MAVRHCPLLDRPGARRPGRGWQCPGSVSLHAPQGPRWPPCEASPAPALQEKPRLAVLSADRIAALLAYARGLGDPHAGEPHPGHHPRAC